MITLIICVVLGALWMPASAHAVECKATDIDRAKTLYAEGKFVESAELLLCISATTGKVNYLFNASPAWLGAKYLAHAIETLSRYLQSGHSKYADKARILLTQSQASCGKLTVTTPTPGQTLVLQYKGRPILPIKATKNPTDIYLDEGQWNVGLNGEQMNVSIKTGQSKTVSFVKEEEPKPESKPKPEPTSKPMSKATIGAWSLVGTSGAAIATGLSLVLVGDRGMRDVDHGLRPTGDEYRDEMLPELNLRSTGYVTLGAGLGFGLTGGTHFLLSSHRKIVWWTELGVGAALAISGISWAAILENRKDGKSFAERWQDSTYFNHYIGAQTLIGIGTGLIAGAGTMLILDGLSSETQSTFTVLPSPNSLTLVTRF